MKKRIFAGLFMMTFAIAGTVTLSTNVNAATTLEVTEDGVVNLTKNSALDVTELGVVHRTKKAPTRKFTESGVVNIKILQIEDEETPL